MHFAFDIGPEVACNLQRLIDTRCLVQANSGGGKSWLLRRILEQTHGHVQHIVLDPEGEFATLRERFDYVLAAPHGADTVAQPRSAGLLAERLLELRCSAIIDLYELKHHERIRFVRLFLEALVNAPKKLWHPVLVVVDEAHVFCPQVGDAESAGAVIDLATRGRKRGYCAILATQRISKLNKDAAAECNNRLIGRTGLDVDMKRAGDELGLTTRDQQHVLRALRPGQFYAFGPALCDSVTAVRVGPVVTSHPKAGARLAFTPPPPSDRVRKLLPQLADLPAEAEQRAATVEDLRKQVAALERDLRAARQTAPAPIVERIEVPVLTDVACMQMESLRAALRDMQEKLETVETTTGEVLARVAQTISVPTAVRLTAFDIGVVRKAPRAVPAPKAKHQSNLDGVGPPLGKCARAVLTVLAQHPDGCTMGKLTLLAGYRNSGGFRNTLGELRSLGYMTGSNGDQMVATPAGLQALGPLDPLPSGPDLVTYWLTHRSLSLAARRILGALTEMGTASMAELLAATGYSNSGGFRNALGELRTAGLIRGRNSERMEFVLLT